ncbi:hypothetical protein QEZ54_17985 [Catellatospora sp. KI3]|uniref:hypothetical protein n=1 Tax=Catellatospora sp. KI3 TaxID=3041620 RepID=UPI002482E412|nr:hypothetical protein [Catellatospora sp. KI3]MDI1462869.1 hypothetical protein [Catellatospora sp. KI3]
MSADAFLPAQPDLGASTEMTHEAMVARWQQGLVTPMSSTIDTFAKTDGSWWTGGQGGWQRVAEADRNERLDYHHNRFGSTSQAKGPVAVSPQWGGPARRG